MKEKFEQFEQQREQLQREVNSTVYDPISFEIFKKTQKEKIDIKNAKERYLRGKLG